MSAPLAIVAALDEEVAALRSRLTARRRESAAVARWWSGRLAGRPVWVGVTGDGAVRARRGLEALLEGAPAPSAIWFAGVAGGLSPGLALGALLAAAEVRSATGERRLPPRRLDSRAGAVAGTLATVERICSRAAEKEALWRQLGCPRPAAVDLESSVWAEVAIERELPWGILRAVSDRAEDDLPLDFNAFLTEEGSVDRAAVARHALLRPRSVRALAALRGAVKLCAERLAGALEELAAA